MFAVTLRALVALPIYGLVVGVVAGVAVAITCCVLFLVASTVASKTIRSERNRMLVMLAFMVPTAMLATAIGVGAI